MKVRQLITVAAALLVACGGGEKKNGGARGDADRLVIGLKSSPTNIDPRVGQDNASGRIFDLCCRGLVRVTPEMDYAPDVATDPNGHHGGVRQLSDAQGDVDPFLDQIGVAVEQDEIDRHGREGFEIGIDDGAQDFLAADRRRRHGQRTPRGGLLACRHHLGFPQIDENAAARGGIALADLAQLDRAGGTVKQWGADLLLKERDGSADRRR